MVVGSVGCAAEESEGIVKEVEVEAVGVEMDEAGVGSTSVMGGAGAGAGAGAGGVDSAPGALPAAGGYRPLSCCC